MESQGYRKLALALQNRKKPVVCSNRVCRTWQDTYTTKSNQPASSSHAEERPSKRSRVGDVSADSARVLLESYHAIETAVGERYRQECILIGLHQGKRNMVRILHSWGYNATEEACRNWLQAYKHRSELREGNAAVYALSRQDLRVWWYVDKLDITALMDKYLEVHGVFADRRNLHSWLQLPAQRPEYLETNEDIHSHASGELVLRRLQNGASPQAVIDELRTEYLVEATVERLAAYRLYREQKSGYWTASKLEREHWEYLYSRVSLESSLFNKYGSPTRIMQERFESVRIGLCAGSVAEDAVPLHILDHFYKVSLQSLLMEASAII